MVAKKKTAPTPQWGASAETAKVEPDTSAQAVVEATSADDFKVPEFLTKGKTTDPAQTELEEAIAATKPDEPKPSAEQAEPDDPAPEPREEATETFGKLEPEQPKAKPSTPIPDVGMAGHNANQALIGYVERVERLAEEGATIREDMKEVFSEAKSNGFDVKIMREAIRRRKMDASARDEHDSILAIYEEALR